MRARWMILTSYDNPSLYILECRTGPNPDNYVCDGPQEGTAEFDALADDLAAGSQTAIQAWVGAHT